MIKCFIDSLVRPSQIASHISMKLTKFLGYLLLLVIISGLPTVINLFNSGAVSELYINTVITQLQELDQTRLNYQIQDGKLINNNVDKKQTIIRINPFSFENMGMSSSYSALPVYIVFNEKNDVIHYSEDMRNENSLIFNFKEQDLEVYLHMIEQTSNLPGGGTELDNQSPFISKTYVELNAEGLNFSNLSGYDSYWVEVKLQTIFENLFEPYLFFIYLTQIPVALFSVAGSLIFEIIFLTGFVFLFYRHANLKFSEIFKIVTFCMTPTVMLGIFMMLPFGSLWSTGLYIIGQILTIVYFYKAIRSVIIGKIKRD